MKELGVSRGTLREAIKSLAHVGMLDVRRGDGTFVRATSEIAGATQKLIGRHGAKHVIEVRLGLDAQAAHLAAIHASTEQLDHMRGVLAARRDAWDSQALDEWVALDGEFHLAVAHASANPLLAELYESFGDALRSTLMPESSGIGASCPHAGHEDLPRGHRSQEPGRRGGHRQARSKFLKFLAPARKMPPQ
ncbi:FadR/GntR family transcriptional regulator [Arthrobacter glacialis]|uniref:FadR/GntR family transcriptional regulator n=1 Tax=Arthrobacter glacialis TaxID=1664 RepID=UPI00311AA847